MFEVVDVKKTSEKENSIISLEVTDKTYSYENFQYNLTLWKEDNLDTIFYVDRVNTTEITIDKHSAGYTIEPNTAYQVHVSLIYFVKYLLEELSKSFFISKNYFLKTSIY